MALRFGGGCKLKGEAPKSRKNLMRNASPMHGSGSTISHPPPCSIILTVEPVYQSQLSAALRLRGRSRTNWTTRLELESEVLFHYDGRIWKEGVNKMSDVERGYA